MRNLKKFLALVLAMLMIVSASAAVSASDFSDVADDSIYAEAIADLVEKGITNGVAEGQFGPDQPVQRFQMALFMARALEPDVDDWMTGMQVFTDVTEWYGAIAYAYVNNIVTGMGNNLFAPHDGIRYQDALIMALRALGYKVDVSGDPYWLEAYNQAQALGLTKGVEVYVGEQVLTRAETAQIIFNMLYTTPADGGATIAAKNFGEATAANTTTFIITATPKQAYADSFKAAEDGYVGIQAIVNGVPEGDVVYIPAEMLGIDDDEIEDYFSYSVDLVNYDPETTLFDRAILGADPVVVFGSDIKDDVSASKISFDGVTYSTVEAFTGAALLNEMVVFNGGEFSTAAKILLFDKDGNICNYDGKIVASFAYETSTGVRYYVDQNVENNVRVISEAVALEKYGVEIADGTYTKYATMSAADLANIGNYQISFYDDDRDGRYERAVATPVYVSVFQAKDDGGETFGPMNNVKDVTYTEDLVKGDMFTYTWNDQTKVVNVLDIIEIQDGILTKINTTAIGDSKVVLTVETDDGDKKYTLSNTAIQKDSGASIYSEETNVDHNIEFDKIASDAKIGYLYNSDAMWDNLVVGARIMYYAVGDYIINAKTYNVEDDYERVILKDIVSYDSENIYVDIYRNGKLETNVAISAVNGDKISGLNIFKLSTLLSDKTKWTSGNLFKFVEYSDDTYELSGAFERGVAAKAEYTADEALTYGLYQRAGVGNMLFDDGIADVHVNGVPMDDMAYAIRTNDDTVFYFIDEKGNVNVYVGAPDNSSIDLARVKLYADKIGYGSAKRNGVASFIVVYYEAANASAIKGFGFTSVDYSVIFVGASAAVDKYERVSASYIGLGSAYTGTYYSYNVDNLAVDMGTGAEVQKVYSKVILKQGHFYKVDSNGVITENADVTDTSMIQVKQFNKDSFDQARYYTITTTRNEIVVYGYGVDNDKVSTVKFALYDFEGTIKTDDLAWFDKAYDVYFIKDYEDGSFVGIVDKDNEADVDNRGNVDAKWTSKSNSKNTYAAKTENISTADYQIKTDLFVLVDEDRNPIEFPGYYATIEYGGKWANMTKANVGDISSIAITDGEGKAINGTFTGTVSYKDSVATITVDSVRDSSKPFGSAYKFVSGDYVITITFDSNYKVEIPVTVK